MLASVQSRGLAEGCSGVNDNERIIFLKRPGENSPPTASCFQHEPCHLPTRDDLETGQCIVRTLYLSADPAQRCRMNKVTGVDYLAPYEEGGLVDGLEGIGIVEVATIECTLQRGDIVTACAHLWPWTRVFIADGNDLVKVELPRGLSPKIILSGVGISGMTALLGIRKKAKIRKDRKETIIARLEGCSRVIGICGSEEKCRWITKTLGFDAAINYKNESVGDRLADLAPSGVDIYFDNVGGFVSDAVIQRMNADGRVVLCGQIAVYNTDLPYPPPLNPVVAEIITHRNISRERFLLLAHKDEMDAAVAQLSQWITEEKLKVNETVYMGLASAPQAFVDMMAGKNIGKMVIKVSEEPAN
ncbi:unnamed protein product, partial [Mesorhabditis spiculigera]